MKFLQQIIIVLGFQRFLLALLTLMSILLCFWADTSLTPDSIGNIIFAVVVPAMPPLLFMVYGLDLLMSRVWRNEFGVEQVRRFDNIAIFDMTIMVLLTIVWLPIFLRN